MSIPYIISDRSLTAYLGGEAFTIDADAKNYQGIVDLLKEIDPPEDELRKLFGGYDGGADNFSFIDKSQNGLVTVSRSGVTYAGKTVNSALADRMVAIAEAGLPLDPWATFMENVMANPAPFAQEELYLWLAKSDLPITDDGCFLAYKKVQADFTDIHTGTFDNSPGQTVVMHGGRAAVDTDRGNTCSTGLHFCSRSYLPQFGNSSGEKVVLVKINPADVVSIPADYENAKGRTWRYEVIQEVTGISYEEMNFPPVVHVDEKNDIYTDYQWEDDWGDGVDEDDEDWWTEDDEVASAAPAPAVKSWWSGLWGRKNGRG